MNLQHAQEFLRSNPRGVLATFRADGRPQLSPVLGAVDDAGHVMISTRETAMKTRNLRHDPRVSLLVMSEAFFGDWVQVEGEAEIISLPEAMEPLIDYYRRVGGEHPSWDDYRAAMQQEQRVIVRFAITRAGPDVSG